MLPLKGAPPIAADPAASRIFRFFDLSENADFGNLPVGFGGREGLQSMGNGCGLQMDGFSAHFEPSEFIFDYLHDFSDFAFVCDCPTLKVPGPRDCPEGPGTLWEWVMVV